MVVSGRTRKKVQHKFKLRGFTFKVDAMEEVLSYLAHFPNGEDEALDLLIDEMYNKSCGLLQPSVFFLNKKFTPSIPLSLSCSKLN